MSRGNRGRLREAMDTALCFGLGPSDQRRRVANGRTAAPLDSRGASRATSASSSSEAPGGGPPDPLAGRDFRTLRELRHAFARGGLPPQSERTPADEARIAAFCVLQELAHVLGQYRRAVSRGGRPRLVVYEHGRQLGMMVIEVRIEAEPT